MVFEVAEVIADEFIEAHGFSGFEAAFDGVGVFGDAFDGAGEEFVVDGPVVEDLFPLESGVVVELDGGELVIAGDEEGAAADGGEEAHVVEEAGVDHVAEEFDAAPATLAKGELSTGGIHCGERAASR